MRFLKGFFPKIRALGLMRRSAGPPLFLMLFLVVQALANVGMVLEFVDVENGKVVYSMPVKPGFVFGITYKHSVDHQTIYEFFRVDGDGSIVLDYTKFQSFGAGMGYWRGRGKLVRCGNWTCIVDMNYRLKSFVLTVGSVGVDHKLVVDGRVVFNFSEHYQHRKLLVRVRGINEGY